MDILMWKFDESLKCICRGCPINKLDSAIYGIASQVFPIHFLQIRPILLRN